MKKVISLLLAVTFIITLFACNSPKAPEQSVTPPEPRAQASEMKGKLTVLSEKFFWNWDIGSTKATKFCPMRNQISKLVKYFREQYPDVEIDVEYLPSNTDNRENDIKQRRVAMMAGKDVPDIYLLPTSSEAEISYSPMEPLFADVAQAMSNNWFADISGLYNGDEDLHTEELNQGVMDAGTIGGARYILPLWYNINTYVTRKDLLDGAGIDRENLNAGIDGMMGEFMGQYENGDPGWAAGGTMIIYGMPLTLLPKLCDYQTEEALVDSEQVEGLLMNMAGCGRADYDKWVKRKGSGEELEHKTTFVDSYVFSKDEFGIDAEDPGKMPMYMTELTSIIPLGKALGYEMEAFPIRASDGSLNAEVTYWGAISAGCKNKKLAYEFLRLFLTPEVQQGGKLGDYDMTRYTTAEDGMFPSNPGWPVRYKGFAEKQWEITLRSVENTIGSIEERKEAVLGTTLDDSDLPILDIPIDHARFPSSMDKEFYQYIGDLQNYDTVSEYSQSDAKKAANEFVRNLKYHLAEG